MRTAAVVSRQLRLLPLVGVLFFSVSGGPYGLEETISSSGPGMTMVLLLVVPLVFGLPCALMVAELGSALPLEGGYYYWCKVALGQGAGVVQGIWNWLLTFLDTALYPIVFADYMAQWIPGTRRGEHVWFSFFGGAFSADTHWLVAVAFMVPLAWLNVRGTRLVGETSVALMVVVLAPFAVLTLYGLVQLLRYPVELFPTFTLPGQHVGAAFGAGLGVVIWNYIGWESPSTLLGEIDRPQRTYLRALMLSLPLITLSYVLPMLATLGSGLHRGHETAWEDGDFASVGRLLAGHWLFVLIVIGAVVSQVGLFSSLLMSGARVPRVMAADGYLPDWLAHDHPRYGTPARAIVVSCVIFAIFCMMDFSALVDADVILNLACLLMQFVALIVMRRRFPALRRPYRVPGGAAGPWLLLAGPAVFTVWLSWSTFDEEPAAFWIGLVMLLLGWASYPATRRWVKRERPDADVDLSALEVTPRG
ncbi:APC family permease [Nocardioides mangrovicus]|uniref:APC family permease n=1 Tax=Nocardioides mangrovicus TaxID=2478913 RepID=UPI00131449D7|nr:APC family permease [Nocardioides mangrovicus]